MQRQIWLTDKDNNERFDFSAFGDIIFTTPTSLGIYRQKSYLIVNNQRITVEDLPSFKTITGTIIIRGLYSELEGKYALLRDFVSKHMKNGFRLYIKTQEDKPARYINCDIDTLDKTEKVTGTIIVPINILPKSLWLGDVSGASVEQQVAVTGMFRFSEGQNHTAKFIKRDSLTDEYNNTVYSIAFSVGVTSQAFIFNGGEETTPLRIRVYGPAVNPHIKLKDFTTGAVLQDVKFSNLTIDGDYFIEINSNPENAYIELVNKNTNEKSDIENYADQDTNVFMNLPVGSYIIEANDDNPTNVVKTRVYFTNQYKGA